MNRPTAPFELNFYKDFVLQISTPEEGSYVVTIGNSGGPLCSKEMKTAPWLSPKIQTGFANHASDNIPSANKQERDVFKSSLIEALKTINEKVESDDEVMRALTSPDISLVMSLTTLVDIYPGNQSEYRITLENGEHLSFTPEEISGSGKALRVKWLNAYPREMLHISIMGFRQIVNYWTEIATEHERETTTDLDSIIEQLAEHLSTLTISTDKGALNSSEQGWWEESNGTEVTVWIPGVKISEFLRDHSSQEQLTSSQLAKELRRRGILTGVSKTLNVGKMSRKCWPFTPVFGSWTKETCMSAPNKIPGVL